MNHSSASLLDIVEWRSMLESAALEFKRDMKHHDVPKEIQNRCTSDPVISGTPRFGLSKLHTLVNQGPINVLVELQNVMDKHKLILLSKPVYEHMLIAAQNRHKSFSAC